MIRIGVAAGPNGIAFFFAHGISHSVLRVASRAQTIEPGEGGHTARGRSLQWNSSGNEP